MTAVGVWGETLYSLDMVEYLKIHSLNNCPPLPVLWLDKRAQLKQPARRTSVEQ